MVRGQAWTGFEASALQEAMRRSVRDFASLLGVETTTVNNWRAGLSAVTPRSSTQSILDTTFTLRTTADDRARFEQIVAEGEAAWRRRNRSQGSRRSRRSNQADLTSHSLHPSGDSSLSDSWSSAESVGGVELLAVLNRLHKLSRSVDDDVVDQMDTGILRAIEDYETSDPIQLVPWLRSQRAWLETLLDECGVPQQRLRLFEIASRTSGLLGYVSVGCGNFSVARAYCLESYQLGSHAEDTGLMAWARGMQSFCEYYAGRYEDALRFAEAGLAEASGGCCQGVRLAANGVARARGKLGDVEGVHRALNQAYELQSRNEPVVGTPSSISLGGYSSAQIAGNAATAYLSLVRPIEVERYGRIALAEMSAADSPWGRALVQIDMARSHALSPDGDFDAAMEMVHQALAPSRGTLMTPVRDRGAEFVHDAAARWGESPRLNTIRDMLGAAGPGGTGA